MNKTERLNITIMSRDKRALERLAEQEGEAMAVVVRRLIREAAHSHGQQVQTQPAGEVQHGNAG